MTPSGGPAVAQVSVSWALGPAAGWCHGGPSPEGGLLGFTAGRGRGSAGHLWRGGRLPAPCEDTPLCSDSPGEAAAVGPRGGLSPQRGQNTTVQHVLSFVQARAGLTERQTTLLCLAAQPSVTLQHSPGWTDVLHGHTPRRCDKNARSPRWGHPEKCQAAERSLARDA